MSLGIVFKGPEGIVLAADSRVTLTAQMQQGQATILIPATYDNATKVLKVEGQTHVGVVTYGVGAIGQQQPRTAGSFIPEFESQLVADDVKRLGVEDFAKRLGGFFLEQWNAVMPRPWVGDDMVFLVGGYDEGAAYGRVFELNIPSNPTPREHNQNAGDFGIVWGGQREFTDRLIQGYDPRLLGILKDIAHLEDQQLPELDERLKRELSVAIPYPFLPLQDCVDLSIFLIRNTITIQNWIVGIRGVGGAIDVATITRTDGFCAVQQKKVSGER